MITALEFNKQLLERKLLNAKSQLKEYRKSRASVYVVMHQEATISHLKKKLSITKKQIKAEPVI